MKQLFLGLIVGALCGVSGCASVTPAPVAGRPGAVMRWALHDGRWQPIRVALPIEGLENEMAVDEAGRVVIREKPKDEVFWQRGNGMAWGTGGGIAGLLYLAYDKNRSSGSSGASAFVDQSGGAPESCNFAGATITLEQNARLSCDASDSNDSLSGP